MITIVETYEVEKEGQTYIVDVYSNGAQVEYQKPSEEPLPPDPMADALSTEEQAQLELQINNEYLAEMMSINTMEV